MKIESINIIHSLVIWQSLLFAIVLITPKYNKRKENKFLASFLLVLGIHFIYNVLLSNNLYLNILPKYSCIYGFLYGPLLFLYIKSHLRKSFALKSSEFLHFLPFIIIVGFTSFGVAICNTTKLLIVPVMLFYCILGFREVVKYKKVMLQVSSNSDISETKWINTLLISMVIVLVLNLVQMQINQILIVGLIIKLEHIVQVCILILVNLIIYQGLKNPIFFQKITEDDFNLVKKDKLITKFNNQVNETHKVLANKLENYMKNNKPFLDSELDLTTLAQSMDTHPKTLSLVINHILNSSFSEYINSYRIKSAIDLIENNSDDQLTIMEVMYDVGFNSRSVFNTMFKKKTGYTPTQYKQKRLK
jgi:AraC-like DNA-binding protein